MFIGEFTTLLGEKNRLAIPKKVRDLFEGTVYITRGYENCLILTDQRNWQKLINNINTKPLLNINVRDTKRFILGGASEIVYDNQGRFVMPDYLKEFAYIASEVVFIGVGEWVEVWSKERWSKKLNELSTNVSDIADRLI